MMNESSRVYEDPTSEAEREIVDAFLKGLRKGREIEQASPSSKIVECEIEVKIHCDEELTDEERERAIYRAALALSAKYGLIRGRDLEEMLEDFEETAEALGVEE